VGPLGWLSGGLEERAVLCPPTVPAGHAPDRSVLSRNAPARVPGEVLSQKFRVEGIVGTGGMGIVVAAHHLALDQRVAIKLMLPELRVRKDLVRRFLREARAAARLKSQHVTRVLDVGALENGAPYIVMEYLDGTDLATYLREHGAVAVSRAAAIVLQAIDAVAEAHALGIIHRDLKPSNLFLTHDGDGGSLVKVLDLGICKVIEPITELRDTSVTAAIGTPVYMAPEQMRSARQADARSDIWSLGVILYELVTGGLPFLGHTLSELCVRAALDPYPPMNRADVPGQFEAVVARCLAKDPSTRFQSVTELAAALVPFASNLRRDTPVRFPIGAHARRPMWRRPLAVAVALLAGSGALALGLSSRRASTTVAAPRPELASHPERAPAQPAMFASPPPSVIPVVHPAHSLQAPIHKKRVAHSAAPPVDAPLEPTAADADPLATPD
jgi:serine/threonine protein kinase